MNIKIWTTCTENWTKLTLLVLDLPLALLTWRNLFFLLNGEIEVDEDMSVCSLEKS